MDEERRSTRRRKKYTGRSRKTVGIGEGSKKKLLSRVVYEQAYGPIPDGYDIHHIDEDWSNDVLDNLLAIPHADHVGMRSRKWPPVCSIEGCERKHVAHGLCIMHYKQAWRADPHSAYNRKNEGD